MRFKVRFSQSRRPPGREDEHWNWFVAVGSRRRGQDGCKPENTAAAILSRNGVRTGSHTRHNAEEVSDA